MNEETRLTKEEIQKFKETVDPRLLKKRHTWSTIKYVVIEKARPHKYIKRTGTPGHFDYFYSEEAQRDAERDIGGGYKPEFTTEDKKLREKLKELLVVKEGSGEYRPTKATMLEDKINKLKGTIEAYALGKIISKEQAIELWKEYKIATAKASKELDTIEDFSTEELQRLEMQTFAHQMMRETVAGHLGESRLAFTRDEIEEKLGLSGVKEEAGKYGSLITKDEAEALKPGDRIKVGGTDYVVINKPQRHASRPLMIQARPVEGGNARNIQLGVYKIELYHPKK